MESCHVSVHASEGYGHVDMVNIEPNGAQILRDQLLQSQSRNSKDFWPRPDKISIGTGNFLYHISDTARYNKEENGPPWTLTRSSLALPDHVATAGARKLGRIEIIGI